MTLTKGPAVLLAGPFAIQISTSELHRTHPTHLIQGTQAACATTDAAADARESKQVASGNASQVGGAARDSSSDQARFGGRGSFTHAAKINLNQRVFRQVNVSTVPGKEECQRGSEAHVPCGICNRGVTH
jgi:hypothetical protein